MRKNTTEVDRHYVEPKAEQVKVNTETPARETTSHDNRPHRKELAGDLLRPAAEYSHNKGKK